MYFTKMTDANHLHINNYGPVDPKHHEKLRNRLPHLCYFSIGCKPESFVWSSLKEAWLLSVPRFKTFFDYGNGSDRRRTVTVTDHTLLMSYIFDFCLLQPGDAKSVEMETALVSDEVLRMLVKVSSCNAVLQTVLSKPTQLRSALLARREDTYCRARPREHGPRCVPSLH